MTTVTNTISEEWRPVVGYEGIYSVSSHGRIKRQSGFYAKNERIARFWDGRAGYKMYRLCDKKRKSIFSVHSVVAAAFIGPRPKGLVINHKDGDRTNNHTTNLEYCTHQDNLLHAHRVLGKSRGEKHHCAKFTEAKVAAIRIKFSSGVSMRSIARNEGVNFTTIQKIVRKKTWIFLD